MYKWTSNGVLVFYKERSFILNRKLLALTTSMSKKKKRLREEMSGERFPKSWNECTSNKLGNAAALTRAMCAVARQTGIMSSLG